MYFSNRNEFYFYCWLIFLPILTPTFTECLLWIENSEQNAEKDSKQLQSSEDG